MLTTCTVLELRVSVSSSTVATETYGHRQTQFLFLCRRKSMHSFFLFPGNQLHRRTLADLNMLYTLVSLSLSASRKPTTEKNTHTFADTRSRLHQEINYFNLVVSK